ncbi:replication initiator protein [Dipodfec virus UOA04_Rod_691]|nr:replication initiator protein [Dipodfec virus UOA04_Rod_691]
MCEHPILLNNPVAVRLFSVATSVCVNGIRYSRTKFNCFAQYIMSCGVTTNNRRLLNGQQILELCNNCYIYVDGTRINSFISGDCGHCQACRVKRKQDITARLILECRNNPYLYFYTLTYSSNFLPDCGLQRKDVVLFLKRFRINLQRWYSRTFKCDINKAVEATSFRTFYVGEYGSKSMRAHYHGLFFFKKPIPDRYLPTVFTIFKKSWGKGYILDFQKCKDPLASAKYVSKYITKSLIVDDYKDLNPLFYQGPSRNGGLGCENLSFIKEHLFNSKDFRITIKVLNKLVTIALPQSVVKKCFPDYSIDYKPFKDYHFVLRSLIGELQKRHYSDIESVIRCYDNIISNYSYLTLGSSNKEFTKNLFKDDEKQRMFNQMISKLSLDKLLFITDAVFDHLESYPNVGEYINRYLCKYKWLMLVEFPDNPDYSEDLQKRITSYNKMLYNVKNMSDYLVD